MRRRTDPSTSEYIIESGKRQYEGISVVTTSFYPKVPSYFLQSDALRQYRGTEDSGTNLIEESFADDLADVQYSGDTSEFKDMVEDGLQIEESVPTTSYKTLCVLVTGLPLIIIVFLLWALSPFPMSMWSRILFSGLR